MTRTTEQNVFQQSSNGSESTLLKTWQNTKAFGFNCVHVKGIRNIFWQYPQRRPSLNSEIAVVFKWLQIQNKPRDCFDMVIENKNKCGLYSPQHIISVMKWMLNSIQGRYWGYCHILCEDQLSLIQQK